MHSATQPVQIIRAEPHQAELVAPLFDRYRQFYGQPSHPEQAYEFVQQRLSRAESVILLAIDPNRAAVGFTQLYPSFSSVALRRIWILNDLFVLPEARHQGVALALLDAAQAVAIETQAKRLILTTAVTNQPAQALYEKAGYVRDTAFHHYQLEL